MENSAPQLETGNPQISDTTDNSASKLLASAYGDNNFTQTDSSESGNTEVASMLSQSVWGSFTNDARSSGDNEANVQTLDFSVNNGEQGTENMLAMIDFKGGASTLSRLSDLSNDAVGRTDQGARVPSDARRFAGYEVPRHNKCASTVSEWLISSGVMNQRDFQIRVKDMNSYLAQRFGPGKELDGKFDLNDYPEGPVGFISATGQHRNGSNHIAFVEREGDNVYIIHNKAGKVVKEDIRDKFYTSDGRPRYKDMQLFNLNQRGA